MVIDGIDCIVACFRSARINRNQRLTTRVAIQKTTHLIISMDRAEKEFIIALENVFGELSEETKGRVIKAIKAYENAEDDDIDSLETVVDEIVKNAGDGHTDLTDIAATEDTDYTSWRKSEDSPFSELSIAEINTAAAEYSREQGYRGKGKRI